jgi:ferredoxin/flavodoxin
MEFQKVIFYCFSGTGNTLSAARKMAEVFKTAGKETVIKNIPDSEWIYDKNALYIFAFPVYEQSLPLFVYDWITKLPACESKLPAATFSTMAKASGFVKTPLKKLLIKKNFNPTAIKELIFPTNFIYKVSDEKKTEIMKSGLLEAGKYAEDILSDKASWPEPSFLVSVFFPLCQFVAGCFNWLFSHYKVDSSCVHCRLCEKLCPVGNIQVTDDTVKWGRKCQVCLRCINFCPQKSIKSSICNLPYKAHYTADNIKSSDFLPKT